MSRQPSRLARLLLHLIPARYRADVMDDLLREHAGRSLHLCRAILISARDARRVRRQHDARESFWSGLGGDITQAIRHARRRPGLTVFAGLIVALAVGVNTAAFSVTRSVLLRPLPFADEARVGFVWDQASSGRLEPMGPGRALDLGQTAVFESSALIGHIAFTVTGLGEAERWSGASVSAPFFDVLGVRPLIGRTFTRDDRGADMVVLSHAFWQSRFGEDPSVVGRTVVLGDRPRVIVGVMGPDFYWPLTNPQPTAADAPTFWAIAPAHDAPERPGGFSADPSRERQSGYVRLVVRVRADRDPASVNAELAAKAGQLAAMYPDTDAGDGAAFVTARAQMLGAAERPLWLLTAATLLVVLGAATNVAGLFLVNLAARQREFAVRAALGAGRWRMARQFLIESLTIAGTGGVVGALGAVMAVPVFATWLPSGLARRDMMSMDLNVLGIALVVTTLVAVLAASAPVVQLWRRPRIEALRTAGPLGARLTGRGVLIGIQAGVAVVVVTLTLLFGASLVRLRAVDVGFDTGNLLTFNIALSRDLAPAARVEFYDRLLTDLRGLPGVSSAGAAVTLPIGGDDFGTRAYPEGRPLPRREDELRIGYQIVSPDWFTTLGVPVLEGRGLVASDTADREQVVVINESLARWAWPGESAVGRRLTTRRGSSQWFTVVGVVKDIHHRGPGAPPRLELYRPYMQDSLSFMAFAVRTGGNAMAILPAIRRTVTALDPALPVAGAALMTDHLRADYEDATTMAGLTTLFGALALMLAAVGVYGAVAFSVTERTAEFGLRAALGARPGAVSALVVRQALKPVAAGCAGGVVAAWMLSGSVRALLFDVAPTSVAAYTAAFAVILAAGAVAAWWPSRRAARVDPLAALRSS